MSSERAVTLLHLSDLQFGPHHRFEGDGALGSLVERLRQDLDPLTLRELGPPDLILLTGDLAENGKKSEFDEVYQFARSLAGVFDLPTRRVVMVPGNHDINRDLSKAYFSECAGNEEEVKVPYWPKLRHYANFFERFYDGEGALRFTEEEPWSFFEYPELKVVVAGFDSAMAESHRPEDHYGFMGETQLRALAERLRPYKEKGFLRIGAVHHNILSPENNDAAKQDFKDFKRIVGPYLNLVLHGHIHEEQLGWLDSAVPVLCIGSAGVKPVLRSPDVPNQYQLVQVTREGLRFGTRAYVGDQKRWVGDLRSDPEGRRWLIEKKVAFEGVHAIFGSAAQGDRSSEDELSRAVKSYREHVARRERIQTTFGLLGTLEDQQAFDFLRLFVPPNTRTLDRDKKRDKSGPTFQPSARLLGSLATHWHVLLGAPGSGKTTLTRWLMLEMCTPGERINGLPEDMIPVRIELSKFDAMHRRSATSYTFFDHVDRLHTDLSLDLRAEALRALAELGRIYWIFDGLDEIINPRSRKACTEMIVGLSTAYPKCRGIVTSRILDAEIVEPLFLAGGFSISALLDFDIDQTNAFLDRWHETVFASAPDLGNQRRARLALALEETPSLRELCRSPLLLTMVAYLNRNGELPRQRHRLYQKVIERMADQWDANKELSANAIGQRFTIDDKLAFLSQLAWQMMNKDEWSANLIDRGSLTELTSKFCQEYMGETPEAARRSAEGLLRHLQERHGLLTFSGGDFYGFAHRIFLEYLAAFEAHDQVRRQNLDLGDIFRSRWHAWSWQEPLTLLCGLTQEDHPEQVIRALQIVAASIKSPGEADWIDYVAFSVRCLAELGQLDQGPMRELAAHITDLRLHLHDGSVTGDPGSTDEALRFEATRKLRTQEIVRALLQIGHPRRARVRFFGRETGTLEETPTGTRFTYAPAYLTLPGATPIAPNLPLRKDPYEHEDLHPYFANLLPQGHHFEQTCRRLHIKPSDRFGVLLAVGADVMGAVEIFPEQEPLP